MRAFFAEKDSMKKDGIAAGTLHMLRQHCPGRFRLTDLREMFLAMKDHA
jgi:hypothetical protein